MGVYHISWAVAISKGINLTTGEQHTVILGRKKILHLECEDTLFYTECSAMMPEGKPAGSGGPASPNGGIATIAEGLRFQKCHSHKKVFVTGHADTKGNADYNQKITANRASCVLAALDGDRDLFMQSADAPHMNQVRSKDEKAGIQRPGQKQILEWVAREFGWPCSPTANPDFWTAVKKFQRSYNDNGKAGNAKVENLAVDGDFGPKCWGAVFDCYEFKVAEMLAVPLDDLPAWRANLKYVRDDVESAGCSEYHPIEQPQRDEYRSQTNRRVEILFFDPGEEPEVACFQGGCDKQACELYDDTKYGKKHISGPGTGTDKDAPKRYFIIAWSEATIDLLPQPTALTLSGPGIPNQRQLIFEGQRQDGFVNFTFDLNDGNHPCTCIAQSPDKIVTLWENQVISDQYGPRQWSGSLSDLIPEPVEDNHPESETAGS